MSRKNLSRPAALLLPALALALTACTPTMRLTASAAGHPVDLACDAVPTVDHQPTATVISGRHAKVTIERTRLRVEGAQWVDIPADAPLEVRISGHRLSVTARSLTGSGTKTVTVEERVR